jgi:hypothetical protein
MQLNLLPPPPFAPTWPASGLAVRALEMLLKGDTIDHPAFERVTQSWRLAAYVRELRAGGWPIEATETPAPIPENERRHIACYRMRDDALAAFRAVAGECPSCGYGGPMAAFSAALMASHQDEEITAPGATVRPPHDA